MNARILVIGAGRIGSLMLYYLVAAEVTRIGIVENEVIALHKLQRQIIYSQNNINESKGENAVL